MEHENLIKNLSRPFPVDVISWRVGSTNADKSKGIALAYIDARDVMTRLDEVCGLDWQCRYSHAADKVICEIGILFSDGWRFRANGAGDTQIEAEKGAISDAFKRAAVMWGIGRYLYSLPTVWVDLKDKRIVKPPALPPWATPEQWDGSVASMADGVGLLDYNALVVKYWNEITEIKFGLQDDGNMAQAVEFYLSIPEADLRKLWKAPTKGGVFTTREREIIKSSEFAQHLANIKRQANG